MIAIFVGGRKWLPDDQAMDQVGAQADRIDAAPAETIDLAAVAGVVAAVARPRPNRRRCPGNHHTGGHRMGDAAVVAVVAVVVATTADVDVAVDVHVGRVGAVHARGRMASAAGVGRRRSRVAAGPRTARLGAGGVFGPRLGGPS